jgi:hypothetical protein
MVHPVHREVQQDENGLVGKQFINMEEESMERVLQDRPDDIADEEAQHRFNKGVDRGVKHCVHGKRGVGEEGWESCRPLDQGTEEEVPGDREPEDRYDVPLGPCEHLKCWLASHGG